MGFQRTFTGPAYPGDVPVGPVPQGLTLEEGDQLLRLEGKLEVLLSHYGLKAPSFMGMRVQDRVVVRVKGQEVAR